MESNSQIEIKEALETFYSKKLPEECRAVLNQRRLLVEDSKHKDCLYHALNDALFIRVINPYLASGPKCEKGRPIALMFKKILAREMIPDNDERAPALNPIIEQYYERHEEYLLEQSTLDE